MSQRPSTYSIGDYVSRRDIPGVQGYVKKVENRDDPETPTKYVIRWPSNNTETLFAEDLVPCENTPGFGLHRSTALKDRVSRRK